MNADWKDYEKEIHDHFQNLYPNADIKHNVTVQGRYSKTPRQIDVLIEDCFAGNRMRIVIDGKYFKKNIDVKCVEMFIGMLNDCEAHKGLLITQKGYSASAIRRAYHDPIDIELDILNFKDLFLFQGFGGIIRSGKHAAFIRAPFGWVIDATRRPGTLAFFYQRGLSYEQALENKECMYVNIRSKDSEVTSLEDLMKQQDDRILSRSVNNKVDYLPTIKRSDTQIKLREACIDGYATKEYTGFLDFGEFVFFCVMFTPEELKKKNIRKLEFVLQQALPMFVRNDEVSS